ncbi:hypothetical protein [Thermomonospora cellulosilytica]|uniref:Uncharacterized protein n=1 Tax=Thermomonospora cellulosilytica TaxID=1411118 RepID=A0A7W3MXK7_9ACTN|nr:hypothetical protein [Thermomonospora cellulosilytica]MBA9003762.1 hypothetical protein [Thermomonospora cellulosilytica]
MTTTNDPAGARQVRPFAAVLQELARGQVHDEASERLHELVDAVREHGAKGTLTLVLEVAPIAKGDVSALTVTGKVTAKPPVGTQASAFFVDDAGNLSRRDPRQTEIPIPVRDDAPVRSAR